MTLTVAILLGVAVGWILAGMLDIGSWWENRRERKRFENLWRREYRGKTRRDPEETP